MAARKTKLHPNRIEEMREKIKATLLINRLEDHVFIKPSSKDYEDKALSDSQVRAALGLLGKILPNISETKAELTGPNGGAIITQIERVIVRPQATDR